VGRQAVVVAVDVRRSPESGDPKWGVYTHGGRRSAGIDAIEFIRNVVSLGAGEILLTSMDRDGTKEGYDLQLLQAARRVSSVPIIASGGAGNAEHMAQAIVVGGADAVLAASIFHFGEVSVSEAKKAIARAGAPVRLPRKETS
jgi:cyclase